MQTHAAVAARVTVLVGGAVLVLVAAHPLWVLRMPCAPTSSVAPRAPTLVLCTHDYEHVDMFAMQREAQWWHAATGVPTAFVVADKLHNHAFCRFVHRGACVPVRGGTVRRALERLRTHHVVLFVYRGATGTGAFHLARAAAPHVLVARVRVAGAPGPHTLEAGRSVRDIVRRTQGRAVSVAYEPLRARPGEDAARFLRALKRQLYATRPACTTSAPKSAPA